MFPSDLGKCKNLTVKFGGFHISNHPIEKINQTTWVINQHELVPDLFRQYGPSISKVSVRFDGHLEPSSDSLANIFTNAAIYGTELMTSFELLNWHPCIRDQRTLMGLDIRPLNMVLNMAIYDSEWSPVMMEQINRVFPNLRSLKLLRTIFKNRDRVQVECLQNLKELEIQIQLQSKYLQANIFGILSAHPNLERVTLKMDGTLQFWQTMSKKLKSLPSLKLGYIPKTITGCGGMVTFQNEKIHLTISKEIKKFELKFDQLKELTLCDTAHSPLAYDRDLVAGWLKFIVENQHIKKLNVFVPRWFEEEHLAMILKKLPRLTNLAILGCGIPMSHIVQTLFLSQSIEKLHLINYGGTNYMEGVLGWSIKKDKNNNYLIQKD